MPADERYFSESSGRTLRIAVGIATRGRAAVLREVVRELRGQTRQPDLLLICHTSPADIENLTDADAGGVPMRLLVSEPGLPRQRNAILDAASSVDAILFLDDDFLMAPRYIETLAAVLDAAPQVVATEGTLIHDDVKGPGLSVAAGLALIAGDAGSSADTLNMDWRTVPHGYGCNMSVRLAVAAAHDVRFDERLPLYGWSEDVDFTHRIGRHGVIAQLAGARGVHLGVKQGRSPGRRLGYSQVANPVYLLRKGSYSAARAGRSVGRNIAANVARAFWPEAYIDRRGRLAGNALAILDFCRGRLAPERILEL